MYSYLKDLNKGNRLIVRAFGKIIDGYLVDVNLDYLVVKQIVETSDIAPSTALTLVMLKSVDSISWETR